MNRNSLIEQLGGIKLVNINLDNIDITEQFKKVEEEQSEFEYAYVELMYARVYKNIVDISRQHLIEEFWDCVQSKLGLMNKLGIDANEVMEGYPKHLEKIKNRPR